jgi:hypothetical protein
LAETLTNLLRVDPERLRHRLIEQELARHPWLQACGREVIREVAAAMVERLPEALDTRLATLVVEAFRRQPPLWEMPAGAAAGEVDIPLPPQRLQSQHRPALAVRVGDRPLLEVVFELSLEVRLEGGVLRVAEGVPRAVAIRRAQGSGILMLGTQVLSRFSEALLALPPSLILIAAAAPQNRQRVEKEPQ